MRSILGQLALGNDPIDRERVCAVLTGGGRAGMVEGLVEQAGACLAGAPGRIASAEGVTVLLDGALHACEDAGRNVGPEALAAAWLSWGEATPDRLQGDFAAVVYDPAAGRAALIADHIGTHPLYWHLAEGLLTFAGDLQDLLALLPAPPDPDEAAIAAYLRFPFTLAPRTFHAGVRAVEPGHMIVVNENGPRRVRWWRPEDAPEIRFPCTEEYGRAFRALCDDAVAVRLPADPATPVGAHLSGGIDSTSVTLTAAELLRAGGRDLTGVYSWSPPVSPASPEMTPYDERLRIGQICEDSGLIPRFGAMTGESFRAFLARPMEVEGVADVADEFPILAQAEADGTRVILSGWGGDEAFSTVALSVPAHLLTRARLVPLLRLMRAHGGIRRPDRMLRFLWRTGIVPTLPDALFRRFGPFTRVFDGGGYLSPRLAAAPVPGDLPRRGRFSPDPRRDIRGFLEQRHLAARMATWAVWGRAHGIAYRYPLTDRRILEFVLGVPPEILWGDTAPRYLARCTLEGRLRGNLTKSDPANERKRSAALLDCWRLLAEEARAGAFDGTCDWLDMARLRADLSRGPSGDETADFQAFIPIYPAVRIWHMAQRFGMTERSRVRLTG